jgi:LysM repeat protein
VNATEKEVNMKHLKSRSLKMFVVASSVIGIMLSVFPVSTSAMAETDNAPQASAPAGFSCVYVVRPGDNLFRIALHFGMSTYALTWVNGITNPNFIFGGMVLRVPCGGTLPPPPSNICSVYTVQRGDWLTTIAARFGVSWTSIAALNHLVNPSLIFPGMRLAIPCTTGTARTIKITAPSNGQAICSPVTTGGSVTLTPFEATLRGRVYNAQGVVVGETAIHVNAEAGQPGNFSGQITFDTTRVTGASAGRVELADLSAKDGSVLASASAPVTFSCGN